MTLQIGLENENFNALKTKGTEKVHFVAVFGRDKDRNY